MKLNIHTTANIYYMEFKWCDFTSEVFSSNGIDIRKCRKYSDKFFHVKRIIFSKKVDTFLK